MFPCLLLTLCLALPLGQDPVSDQDPLALNTEMQIFLDQHVDRGLPEMDRLQSLANAVFQGRDLSFTYSNETRTAIGTFQSRNGNCLSFTIMFIAMARYLNLDARFREVEIAPTWSKNGEFVTLNRHVNAAVFFGGLWYAIDVFPGVNRIEIGGEIVSDARGLAHFYNNLGVQEMGSGNFAASEAYVRKALECDPTTAFAWVNLGAVEYHLGQMEDAEKYLRKALELKPKDPAALSNLAEVCLSTGRAKEAHRLQAKVKEFQEANPYHQYYLGTQAFDEGRIPEAIACYRRAIKIKRTEHNFYFAIAKAYLKIGENELAMKNLQLAEKYASDPSNKQRYYQKLELLKATAKHGNGVGHKVQ